MILDVCDITAAIATSSCDAAACADAFGRLYDWKFDLVFCVIRAKTGADEATCLDLVQETMMRVIRHIKPMPTEAALDSWLTRVAVTTAYDHYRGERRRRRREAVAAGCERSEPASHDVRLDSLRAAISELDPAAFDLLILRFSAGLTLERIGQRIGLKAGAADGRIRRLIQRLRERVQEDSDD